MNELDLRNEDKERFYREESIPAGAITGDLHWQLLNFHGNLLFKVTKRKLLNLIEGIGLPDKQEVAVKRMVTDELHQFHEAYDRILGHMSEIQPITYAPINPCRK